jgi:Sec7-like guanine-nucleotide exchange factor
MDLQLKIEFNNQLKKSIEKAIIMFNEKPRKGVDFLIKNHFIDPDP